LEQLDYRGSAPRTAAGEAPATGDNVGASSLKGDVRTMSFAAGEAHMTPNESKGPKRKGEVEIGAGDVTSIADVPRGETARIEALVADTSDGRVERTAQAFDAALTTSSGGLSSRRDAVEALYLRHLENEPQTAGFKDAHASRSALFVKEAPRYMDAGCRTDELRLVAGLSLSLYGRADHDFRDLSQVLCASGRATEGEAGVEVDAEALSKEGAVLKNAGSEAGMHDVSIQRHGNRDLEVGYRLLTTAIRDLTEAAYKIRSQALGGRSKQAQDEVDLYQTRIDAANAVGALVTMAASVVPQLRGVVDGLEGVASDSAASESRDVPSATGLITQLIAGTEIKALRLAQAKLAGLEQLLAANENDCRAYEIQQGITNFQSGAENFLGAIDGSDEQVSRRRANLLIDGGKLDNDARKEGDLDDGQERFKPIAQRFARLEASQQSNRLAAIALAGLEENAMSAASTVDVLVQPIADKELFDLRRGLGDNVPRTMTRHIKRYRAELDDHARIVTASTRESQS